MDAASVLAALAALGGVGLGAWLSSRQQQAMLRAADDRATRQARERAYINFLAAYRQFRRFLLANPGNVTLLPGPEGQQVAKIADSAEYWRAVDEAFANIELLAGPGAIRQEAKSVGKALWKLAESCAQHPPGQIPNEDVDRCREAERRFAEAARRELTGFSSGPPVSA
jgi:hypothetical protein